jgi:NAD-dependent deacetylase
MNIKPLVDRLRRNTRITVLTGAGVSAASGVPTFRGAGGFWQSHKAETLATAEAFSRDPATVWEWYDWRRQVLATKQPNRAHEVLAAWSRRFPQFRPITQNVDGLHERAGTESVIRFHGSIWEVFCWNQCNASPRRWRDETVPFPSIPPRCPHCGGLVRPGVVWFGEGIDPTVMDNAVQALDCDVFLTIGTSAQVYPAAGLVAEARRRGAYAVEMNIEATPASSSVDLVLQGPAEKLLDEIERLIL